MLKNKDILVSFILKYIWYRNIPIVLNIKWFDMYFMNLFMRVEHGNVCIGNLS